LKGKILIVGLGSVGGYVLEFLARNLSTGKIIVGSRDEEWGIKKTNITKIGAALMGFYPDISSIKMDLNDIEGTAETLREVQPDIILNSTRKVKGIKFGSISVPLDAGYAMWLCWHLQLPYKLALAIRKAGIQPKFINTSYSDAVCPVLSKLGLAPTVGVGNINHLIPRIQRAVSEEIRVPANNVSVYMVGSHFHDVIISREGRSGGAPYLLKVLVYGEDVTDKLGPEKIFSKCNIPVPTDKERNLMVASSATKMITAIINDTKEIVHSPGPNGLIGGYPVQVSANGVKVVLPSDWSLEEAIRVNKESMKFDGLEEIKDDGTIVFTEKIVKIFREAFSFYCPELKVSEWEKRGEELLQRVFKS
jgi:hypothetical protein